MDPCSLMDWREGLDAGDLSAAFLAHRCLDRISALDGDLNAVAHVDPGLTLAAAREADARLARGERGPMLGIPVVLKDNLNWRGTPTGNGSRITRGYVAPYDATVVRRLLEAGAVPVAKASMDEFAMGSSGENAAQGPARNPWDPSRVPGGSSSGSAVAVAAGYAPFALGSDTGGSVRLPASFCNLTALRPTYGVLSRHGVTAMASSLDQVGPMAASAADLAAGFLAMTGRDAADATSRDLPPAGAFGPRDLRGLRIGLPRECFGEGLEDGVRAATREALDALRDLGARTVEVSLPHTAFAIDTYYLLNTAEVSSNLSRFDGLRYGARAEGDGLVETLALTRDAGFGLEAKRRILLGTFCLSRGWYEAFYLRAQKARTLVAGDFAAAFGEVDVLATPVCPTPAFPIGERAEDPLAMYLTDVYTVTPALAGLPALSMPAGFSGGLPVGLQLIGPALSDVALLETAHAFQLSTGHHRRMAPLPC